MTLGMAVSVFGIIFNVAYIENVKGNVLLTNVGYIVLVYMLLTFTATFFLIPDHRYIF